ncbi:permease [uncultured Eubacterium sp.]|uniref:aspartate-alanine antiporter-like transporter n=1 Tax=uncultured Eubacterium sp. TaxID=165185 RepID=UPI002805ADB6|nr:permease [uncultured Eubacterium sp.]
MDFGIVSVTGVAFLTFSVLAIAAVGYTLGRITIKGVNLGTAGVFIVALLFGAFLFPVLDDQLLVGDEAVSFTKEALKIVENLGLIFFVTSVGFIAGPKFFRNMKKNFKSYVLLGIAIIASASLMCALCVLIGGKFTSVDHETFKSTMVGLFAGALTSTPAFSASKEAVSEMGAHYEDAVSAGYAIAYLFGVIGVVLFVQIIPKITKADMAEELKKISVEASETSKKKDDKKLILLDELGFTPFSLAAILGVMLGSIKFKGFSLTTTGGCILVALVFGHFGRIGKISIIPEQSVLRTSRELGLMMFLIGAGVSGGAKFVQYFEPIYFLYGAVLTLVPMVIGYVFAKFVLKMPLLNNLGSITGGMTSTPALGTLISVAGTEDVASAYAATYPVALISVVVASKLIIMFC